jgi:hypothetical protein
MKCNKYATWPEALEAARAAGYTHVQLRFVISPNGDMIEHPGPLGTIDDTLAMVAECEDEFTRGSERLELPRINRIILDGPLKGRAAVTYEVTRQVSVWERLRQPAT